MIKFLIESFKNEVRHDFSFHLIESIKYKNWFNGEENYGYTLSEDISSEVYSKYIPIGSIEFVHAFYKHHYGVSDLKPINIPEELLSLKYLQRKIFDEKTVQGEGKDKQVFVKSADKLKSFTDFLKVKDIPTGKKLFISEVVDFISEWRAFVYRGQLLDVRCYSGNFRVSPDYSVIESMIEDFKNSPIAYTLDVGVIDKNGEKTVVIEVHHFYSCGLYGFKDYHHLIQMFVSAHREILKNS